MSSTTVDRPIPLYSYDGRLVDRITPRRLAHLESLGLLARVVRHRKGTINRAILHRREGECGPLPLTAFAGTKYSFRQHLADGHMTYRLRALGRNRHSETDLAPASVRPIFLRVVLDCMQP